MTIYTFVHFSLFISDRIVHEISRRINKMASTDRSHHSVPFFSIDPRYTPFELWHFLPLFPLIALQKNVVYRLLKFYKDPF